MTWKSKAWFRTTNILTVIIADWELSVWSFFVACIHNADITTTEDRTFVGVVSDGELGKVKTEFFTHIQGEDERFQWFVCSPLFLGWAPADRCVSSNYFSKLCLDDGHCACLSIAFFVELLDGEWVFTGSEEQFQGADFSLEQPVDGWDVVHDSAVKTRGR